MAYKISYKNENGAEVASATFNSRGAAYKNFYQELKEVCSAYLSLYLVDGDDEMLVEEFETDYYYTINGGMYNGN